MRRGRGSRLVAAVAGVAAIAAVAGCGGGGGPGPSEVVARTVEATALVGSFHFVYDAQVPPPTGGGLSLSFAEGDVALPDRVEADVTGTFLGVSIHAQLVTIGEQVYLLDPLTRSWRTVDVDTTPLDLFDPEAGVLAAIEQARDLELAGRERVAEAETYRVVGTVPRELVAPLVAVVPGAGDVPVEIFVGVDDELLRRVILDGPVGEGEPDGATRTIELSEFDKPVTIEPPPVTG